jgi:hypothetical protein
VNNLSFVSLDLGKSVRFVLGTNIRLDSKFRRFWGGKYTPFSSELNSIRERSILLPPALAEAFNKARNVCFVGVKKRSSTLQKATETPRIARNDELLSAEKTIMTIPVMRTTPIKITDNISWLNFVFLVGSIC